MLDSPNIRQPVEIFPKSQEEAEPVVQVMMKENFSEFSQDCMFSL